MRGELKIDWREALFTKIIHITKVMQLNRLFYFSFSFRTHQFTDYFKGFEKVEAVQRIFKENTEEVLHNLRIEFSPFSEYMGVNSSNGHLIVNPSYLVNGDTLDVYFDVIHELVHIRQYMDGRSLFDTNYNYADRPTEIEAYIHVVDEARRLGLSDERIYEYLKVPWISDEDLKKLAKTLTVKYT